MFSVRDSMTNKIIVQKDGGVGHIRLNQPGETQCHFL